MTLTPKVGFTVLMLVAGLVLGACGDDGGSGDEVDAAVAPECVANGLSCTTSDECCTNNCDADLGICTRVADVCGAAGDNCGSGPDCCSYSCVDFICSDTQCVSDNEACTDGGECCSGTCTGGSCAPLNGSCKTSGNSCTDGGECCSKYCLDGVCNAAPSYCAQSGDVCTNDYECCGGMCSKAEGANVGTCTLAPASGAGGCTSAGEVCGGEYMGEALPTCGGECCSRACRPHSQTGILICQPPSGCRPTGETCQSDDDCCGSANNPDGEISDVTCSKVDGNPIGRCDAGNSCTPAGGICRLSDSSCNENANCCAGNTLQFDTCALDNLGIPRCLAAEIDCTDPSVFEGEECATSADCCGLPCTPIDNGEFPTLTCGGEACVPADGVCTNNADCCSGLPCILEPGSTSGTCGDTPEECASYGQSCTVTADCCNSVTCNADGICGSIVE